MKNNAYVLFFPKAPLLKFPFFSTQAPPGHVITGVKLRNIGGHINLEVQVTPIKFTDGKLLADRSTWIGNDATPVTEDRRREVHILMPDIPTNYHSYSEIDSEHNQYIQFDASSAQKDVRMEPEFAMLCKEHKIDESILFFSRSCKRPSRTSTARRSRPRQGLGSQESVSTTRVTSDSVGSSGS